MEVFTGYWNGEPAKYRVVMIQVGPEPAALTKQLEAARPGLKRYLWFVPFIGTQRQAVEVHYGQGEPFYLDNEDGRGLLKVTEGMGSWKYGHKSVYPQPGIHAVPVPKADWIKYVKALGEKISDDIDVAWRAIDREGYNKFKEETDALRRSINQMRNQGQPSGRWGEHKNK